MDAFTSLAATFSNRGVLYVVIGAWGANYYAPSGGAMVMTLDRDIFLPAAPDNLLAAWHACEASGFGLFAGAGPWTRRGMSPLPAQLSDAAHSLAQVTSEVPMWTCRS